MSSGFESAAQSAATPVLLATSPKVEGSPLMDKKARLCLIIYFRYLWSVFFTIATIEMPAWSR